MWLYFDDCGGFSRKMITTCGKFSKDSKSGSLTVVPFPVFELQAFKATWKLSIETIKDFSMFFSFYTDRKPKPRRCAPIPPKKSPGSIETYGYLVVLSERAKKKNNNVLSPSLMRPVNFRLSLMANNPLSSFCAAGSICRQRSGPLARWWMAGVVEKSRWHGRNVRDASTLRRRHYKTQTSTFFNNGHRTKQKSIW